MSERIETLKKARERMTDDRDAFAKTLAAPFDRDKAERARLKFIETQVLIDAIDRAIQGEQAPDRSRCIRSTRPPRRQAFFVLSAFRLERSGLAGPHRGSALAGS